MANSVAGDARATSQGPNVSGSNSANSNASTASRAEPKFYCDVLLRLMVDARNAYLNAEGMRARTRSELFWKRVLSWSVESVRRSESSRGRLSKQQADKLGVQRRLYKFLLSACKKYKEDKRNGNAETRSIANEFDFVLSVSKEVSMLSQIYKYASHILPYNIGEHRIDTRAYQMYHVMARVIGKLHDITGEARIHYIPSSKFHPKDYFEKPYFFNIGVKGREAQSFCNSSQFVPSSFLVMLKLAIDLNLMKKNISPSGLKRCKNDKPAGPKMNMWTATSASAEFILYAWNEFAEKIGFKNAEEMLAPFIYVDSRSGRLEVTPKGHCIADKYRNQLYEADTRNANIVHVIDDSEDESVSCKSFRSVGEPFGSTLCRPINRKLSASTNETLREYAVNFLKDIYKDGGSKNVLNASKERLEAVPELAKYVVPDDGDLPPRFTYGEDEMSKVRNAVNSARIGIISAASSARGTRDDDNCELDTDMTKISEGRNVRIDRSCSATFGAAAKSNRTGKMVAKQSISAPVGPTDVHTCDASCDCSKLWEVVDFAVSAHCMVMHAPFSEFLREVESNPDISSIKEKVQFILTDPPYNVRRERGRANAAYDSLHERDMEKVVNLCADLLRPGGHAILFCSIDQFSRWHALFRDHLLSDLRLPTFRVTSTPLVFVPEEGSYRRAPYYRNVTHMNVTEFGVHVTKYLGNGQHRAACSMVRWQHFGYIRSKHAVHTNIVDGVPLHGVGEKLTEEDTNFIFPKTKKAEDNSMSSKEVEIINIAGDGTENARTGVSRKHVRAEQKSVALCMELLEQYSKPGDIVVDFFAGTCSTAVACLSLPKRRIFYGCDIDRQVVERGQRRLVKTVLYNDAIGMLPSDLTFDQNTSEGIKTLYNRHRWIIANPKGIHSITSSSGSSPPDNLPLAQRLPAFILEFLANHHEDVGFFSAEAARISPDKWSAELYGLLNETSSKTLLNIVLSRSRLYVEQVVDTAGFATSKLVTYRDVEPGSVIGHVYGTLFYCDWARDFGRLSKYGIGLYAVDRRMYAKRAVPLLRNGCSLAVNENQKYYNVLLVPACFCPFQYADIDGRARGTANAEYSMRSPASLSLRDITEPTFVEVVATSFIPSGSTICIAKRPRHQNAR